MGSNHLILRTGPWPKLIKTGLRRPALRRGPATALFAVYDGHGEHGQEVSQFAMEYIRDNLHKHPSFSTDCRRL